MLRSRESVVSALHYLLEGINLYHIHADLQAQGDTLGLLSIKPGCFPLFDRSIGGTGRALQLLHQCKVSLLQILQGDN